MFIRAGRFQGCHILSYLVNISHVGRIHRVSRDVLCRSFRAHRFLIYTRMIWPTLPGGSRVLCIIYLVAHIAWLGACTSYTDPAQHLIVWMYSSGAPRDYVAHLYGLVCTMILSLFLRPCRPWSGLTPKKRSQVGRKRPCARSFVPKTAVHYVRYFPDLPGLES